MERRFGRVLPDKYNRTKQRRIESTDYYSTSEFDEESGERTHVTCLIAALSHEGQ